MSDSIPGFTGEKVSVDHAEATTAGHWPHLVGEQAADVEKKIQEERPDLHVVKVKHNSMVTMDFRTDRVRVFFGDDGKVVRPPRVG